MFLISAKFSLAVKKSKPGRKIFDRLISDLRKARPVWNKGKSDQQDPCSVPELWKRYFTAFPTNRAQPFLNSRLEQRLFGWASVGFSTVGIGVLDFWVFSRVFVPFARWNWPLKSTLSSFGGEPFRKSLHVHFPEPLPDFFYVFPWGKSEKTHSIYPQCHLFQSIWNSISFVVLTEPKILFSPFLRIFIFTTTDFSDSNNFPSEWI